MAAVVRRTLAAVVLVAIIVTGASVFLLSNPGNWGVSRSSRYSESRFRAVRPGQPIEQVITALGAPIAISAEWCIENETVRTYVFAGDPVDWWVIGYTKSWVLVSPEGNVVRLIEFSEP